MKGPNDNREEIAQFLEEQLGFPEEDGAVSVVGLTHIAHNGEQDIHSFKSGGANFTADKMASTIDAIATRHARGIAGGGVQQFQITICRGPEGKITTVMPFIRVGPTSQVGIQGSLATEPPTEFGRLQQSMRWGEQQVQLSYAMTEKLMTSQQKAIDSRDETVERLNKQNAELWLAAKQLLMELDKQRHDVRMQELNAARMAEFQRQVMVLAPAILNMISGKEVFPISAADTSLVDGIASWASPEDVQAWVAVLNQKPGGDKLGAILVERFRQHREKRLAIDAEEKRLMSELPGRTFDQAEADAAGEAVRALLGEKEAAGRAAPKQLPKKANGNGNGGAGHGSGHDESAAQVVAADAASKDTELLDELFGSVPEGQIEMLAAVLGASKPELAAKIRRAYEERKA